MKRAVGWLIAVLGYAGTAWAEPPLVRACDNDQDYPPFRWQQQGADGRTEIKGLGLTLVRQILATNNWRMELDLLPLRRCLQEVATGERYQLIISSSPNAERLKTYRATDPFDYVHFHAFYLRSRFPEAPPVQQKSDLLKHKVCGLAGHNFAMFGIPAERIDTGAESFAAVFQMLRSGRCEVLPYNLEAIEGLRLIGQDVLASGEFAHTPISDVPAAPLVMLVTRSHRRSLSLLKLINRELAAMTASGELQQLQQAFRANGNAAATVPEAQQPNAQ